MKRIPAAVWILLPLGLGLLYAVGYGLFAPTPTLANVVPPGAVMTQRFRDLATLDEAWWQPASASARGRGSPSEQEAGRRNLAGLPGVDRHAPVHLAFLPRSSAPDPTMLILPVLDADALRGRFEDPSFFLERGWLRHAQFLEIRGSFAAISGDAQAVRRLGEGGLTAVDLGEDHALAVDVPGALEFALHAPGETPWNMILPALGFDTTRGETDATGKISVVLAERLLRVYENWREARMWSWMKEGRIRIDLLPAPESRLAGLLDALGAGDRGLPQPPPRAQAWIRLAGGPERAAFAEALYAAGVAMPHIEKPQEAGLLLWASPSPGLGYAWTLGIAAPRGTLPDLTPFHPAFGGAAEAGGIEVPEGELVLTLADLQLDRSPPAGTILERHTAAFDVVVAGKAAEETWRRFETWLARGESRGATDEAADTEGWTTIATFGLVAARARTLLGGALERGGFLRPLHGGPLTGALLTDGRTLRIEIRVDR